MIYAFHTIQHLTNRRLEVEHSRQWTHKCDRPDISVMLSDSVPLSLVAYKYLLSSHTVVLRAAARHAQPLVTDYSCTPITTIPAKRIASITRMRQWTHRCDSAVMSPILSGNVPLRLVVYNSLQTADSAYV